MIVCGVENIVQAKVVSSLCSSYKWEVVECHQLPLLRCVQSNTVCVVVQYFLALFSVYYTCTISMHGCVCLCVRGGGGGGIDKGWLSWLREVASGKLV